MQWVESGISVYFFPRNAIPSDITSGAPQPDSWGLPMARWPATDCDPSQFFSDHSAIFDTTFWYVPPKVALKGVLIDSVRTQRRLGRQRVGQRWDAGPGAELCHAYRCLNV